MLDISSLQLNYVSNKKLQESSILVSFYPVLLFDVQKARLHEIKTKRGWSIYVSPFASDMNCDRLPLMSLLSLLLTLIWVDIMFRHNFIPEMSKMKPETLRLTLNQMLLNQGLITIVT